jgi:putative ABC transport system ATP-binding protein
LALLDPLDEGEIQWKGHVVSGQAVPAYRKEVIYLHQRPTLFDGSIEANLRRPFALNLHQGREFNLNRISALLESIGRPGSFLAKQGRDLSGGEAQIVALLRAIQLDPTILLLDEPTASLDQGSVRAIEGLVGRWLEEDSEGRAVVWVSHVVEQARRVSTCSLALQSGRLGPEA